MASQLSTDYTGTLKRMVVTVALSNMHFASNLAIIIAREESFNPLRRRASPQAPHWNEDRSERRIFEWVVRPSRIGVGSTPGAAAPPVRHPVVGASSPSPLPVRHPVMEASSPVVVKQQQPSSTAVFDKRRLKESIVSSPPPMSPLQFQSQEAQPLLLFSSSIKATEDSSRYPIPTILLLLLIFAQLLLIHILGCK